MREADARREEIEQLVDAVHGHARTLALLAPALRERGVEATRTSLVELMAEMARRLPGSRERSLFASVELSLRRLSPANRDRAAVLGVFHGGVRLDVLRQMMGWDEADVAGLADELVATGLATRNRYNHLTLVPALCPYLAGRLDAEARASLAARWVAAMREYVEFLYQQRNQNTELAATLTGLELPNLFALLDRVQAAGEAEATVDLTTSLYSLLSMLGKPRLLAAVGRARDAAAATLGDAASHARSNAAATRIEQQLAAGQLAEALEGSRALLGHARAAGEAAYPDADYDLAYACWLQARVLERVGWAEQALPLLDEARRRFEAIAPARDSQAAAWMASACLAARGDCLFFLGRLDDAATAHEESIRRAEQRGDDRAAAVGKLQLGTVRLAQRRYGEALAAYAEARERFAALDEPATVAVAWHQTGMAYQDANRPDAAEDAYRRSLAIEVRLRNVAGQARTLGQLGNLYNAVLGRPEEAAAFYRQAADKHIECRDTANEGRDRNNLAITLRKLGRLDEARQEIRRAIECGAQFGHASSPWASWDVLADIETDAGDPVAAAVAREKAVACYLAYRRDGGRTTPARAASASPWPRPCAAANRQRPRRSSAKKQPVTRPLALAASSATCKPSSPAAATAASPLPICTTSWPRRSCG